MHTPVFFSVGGKVDAEFAKKVHGYLGERIAYHYQITGPASVNFKDEIEAKITECKIFVIFWSSDYLKSDDACNELAFFRKLAEEESSERQLIIVQCGEPNLDISSKWTNPISQSKDEFVLGKWRFERAIENNADANHVAQVIRRKLQTTNIIREVMIIRGWITDQFKNEISLPGYKARELVFVTGLEGHGRRTALRQYMHQASPQRIERVASIDSVSSPEDLLTTLLEVSSTTRASQDLIYSAIEEKSTTVIKEIRKILHQTRNNKSYYVITVDRFAGVDTVTIPSWLSEVMSVFTEGDSPLVFIVTSSPVSDNVLSQYKRAGRVRLPGLEDEEVRELVHKLSLEDPEPKRWTEKDKSLLASSCGNSPALCKSIMRNLASEPNLDFVSQIAERAIIDFSQSMAALMAHWVNFYKRRESDLFALMIIERLGVVSKMALDEIMEPIVKRSGEFDLYTLRDQGLVEQLSDGIYRICPLVQRRLGDALWGVHRGKEVNELFANFKGKNLIANTDCGPIYATNFVAAALRSDMKEVPLEYNRYITISVLFKAGYYKYSNGQNESAHKTLQRAVQILSNGTVKVDLSTEVEIMRFAGLAAARSNHRNEMEFACKYLETKFLGTKRVSAASAMAEFVRGFKFRLDHKFIEAIEKYQNALKLLASQKNVERQRAAIYTELTSSYLRTSPPDFHKALETARKSFNEKDTIHSLNVLIHALILFVYRFREKSNPDLVNEIEIRLKDLAIRCKQNGKDFYDKRMHEYERERMAKEASDDSVKILDQLPTADDPS